MLTETAGAVPRSVAAAGPRAGGGAVSPLAGAWRRLVDRQPGFTNMRKKATTWMPATMPRIFKIFMGGAECWIMGRSAADWLLKNGGFAEAGHQSFKLIAPVGIAAKHVKAGKCRAEDHRLTRPGGGGGAVHRLFKRTADGVRDVRGRTEDGQRRAGLPDEPEMLALSGNPTHEGAEVAAFGPAAQDEVHGRGKRGQGRFHRMKVGGLGIVPKRHAAEFADQSQPVAAEPERMGGAVQRGLGTLRLPPPGQRQLKILPLGIKGERRAVEPRVGRRVLGGDARLRRERPAELAGKPRHAAAGKDRAGPGMVDEIPLGREIALQPRMPFQVVLREIGPQAVSYTHLRAHETVLDLVCRLLL